MVYPVSVPPELRPVLSNTWFGGGDSADTMTRAFESYGEQVLALETVLNAFKKGTAKPEADLAAAMRKSEAARLKAQKTLKSLSAHEKKMAKDVEAFKKASDAGDTKKAAAMKKKAMATDKAHQKVLGDLKKQHDKLHDEILKGITAWKALKKGAAVKEPMHY